MIGVLKEPGAVREVALGHAQLLRAAVHALDEDLLAAAEMLGHRHRAVVGRYHGDAFEHLVHAHLLALLQIDAASAEGGRPRAGRDGVFKADPAALNVLDDQQQRHHLCHARGGTALVRALLVEQFAGLLFHQHGARRRDLELAVPERLGLRGGEAEQNEDQPD